MRIPPFVKRFDFMWQRLGKTLLDKAQSEVNNED
jgi:hypothetical protein